VEVLEAIEALREAARGGTTFTRSQLFPDLVVHADEVYGTGVTFAGSVQMIDSGKIAVVFGRAVLHLAVAPDDTLLTALYLRWVTSASAVHSTLARYQLAGREAREHEEDKVIGWGDTGVIEATWQQVIPGITSQGRPEVGVNADAARNVRLYHSAAIQYGMSLYPELAMLCPDAERGVVLGSQLVNLTSWLTRYSPAPVTA